MIRKNDFFYGLPAELIAQTPLADRAASRLMALERETGKIKHDRFINILSYFNRNDCLVINDTRVMPARFCGVKKNTGARIELLLLRRIDRNGWEALVRPGKRVKNGDVMIFGDGALTAGQEADLGDGVRFIRFAYEGVFEEILDSVGETPLPPYITEKLADGERYQTVYAANYGSAAAPTAGLHFTESILKEAAEKGIFVARVTLHVGLGTFRPVKNENIAEHIMHAEYYEVDAQQAEIIAAAKKAGGKIVCVGTTSCRTLETIADADGTYLAGGRGSTDIFIYPGYEFKLTDALITNFHLPESTLLMLVSAFAGRENVLRAYAEAVKERYRFFSFGDAMLII